MPSWLIEVNIGLKPQRSPDVISLAVTFFLLNFFNKINDKIANFVQNGKTRLSRINLGYYYRPQKKFAEVMFLQLSVILFTGGGLGV